ADSAERHARRSTHAPVLILLRLLKRWDRVFSVGAELAERPGGGYPNAWCSVFERLGESRHGVLRVRVHLADRRGGRLAHVGAAVLFQHPEEGRNRLFSVRGVNGADVPEFLSGRGPSFRISAL